MSADSPYRPLLEAKRKHQEIGISPGTLQALGAWVRERSEGVHFEIEEDD